MAPGDPASPRAASWPGYTAFWLSLIAGALAVFAAASLAKANMWQSGFAAMRAAAPAYVVPFMFVYEPMLLLIVPDWSSQWAFVAWSVVTASVGVICLAASLFGWLLYHGLDVAGGRVVVTIHPSIETAHLGLEATNGLRDRVRAQIQSRVSAPRQS